MPNATVDPRMDWRERRPVNANFFVKRAKEPEINENSRNTQRERRSIQPRSCHDHVGGYPIWFASSSDLNMSFVNYQSG